MIWPLPELKTILLNLSCIRVTITYSFHLPSCLTCPPSIIYWLKWLLYTCFPNFCHFPRLNSKATCYIWNSQALFSLTLDLATPSTMPAQCMVSISLRQQLPSCGLIFNALRGLITIFNLLQRNTLTIDFAYLDPVT